MAGHRFRPGVQHGSGALQAAMWACKVGVGDEVIAPSVTYWATILPCFSLGATSPEAIPHLRERGVRPLGIAPMCIRVRVHTGHSAVIWPSLRCHSWRI